MALRWWRRRDPTERKWRVLAERLGLEVADDGPVILAEQLDLPADAALGPIYRVDDSGQVEAYLFYYRHSPGPRSGQSRWVTACLLVSAVPLSPVSWRAMRKLHSVISSLQASATGGEVLVIPGAEKFNERVTVVARDGGRLASVLGPAVRTVLERALTRGEPPATLTVGERRILLSATAGEVALEAAEPMLSDTLSLYAALEAS
jgi:hypothetical protein